MVIQGVNYPSDFESKKAMQELGKRLEDKGYCIAGEGSISVRTGPNAVWITAADADKCSLEQSAFLRMDMNGKVMASGIGGKDTRLPEDHMVHLKAYKANPSLRSIVHAYPAEAVIFEKRNEGIEPADFSPATKKLGRMQLVDQTNAAGHAEMYAMTDGGMLSRGDGIYVWAENLKDCMHKLASVSYYVKVKKLLCSISCKDEAVSPAPVYTGIQTRQPAFDPSGIQGLTPVIRPGESLPAITEAPKASAVQAVPVRSAMQTPASAGTGNTAASGPFVTPVARKPVEEKAPPVFSIKDNRQIFPAGTIPVTMQSRKNVMDEVIRRSMKNL